MASWKIPRAYPRSGNLISPRAYNRQTVGNTSVRRATATVGKIETLENRCHLTAVTSFTLVDAITNKDISTLPTGSTINLSTLKNKSINIRANTDSTTGSVEFIQDGKSVHVENAAPYALYSDLNGDYKGQTPPTKGFTLAAIPYAQDFKAGFKGATYQVALNVVDQPVTPTVVQAVTGFTLYNADTNSAIGTLHNGDTINLGSLPTTHIALRAETTSTAGSIVFGLDSNASYYTDTKSAFYMNGDSGTGNIYAWVPLAGSHTLTATPVVSGATASSLKAGTINFTVVNNVPVSAPTVSIVNPLTNSTKVGPAQYVVFAKAADVDGTISKVEFYAGKTLIGITTDAPYSVAWTDVLPGTYSLVAKAFDNTGLATLSTPVTVTVKAFTTDKSYYVSPTGNDANPGTSSAPFKTIGRAAKVATAGMTVLIQPGTYRETVWLSNSGTSDKPITFKAVTPGTVVIDGADLVSGWTKSSGAIYSTVWNYDFFMAGSREYGKTFNGTQFAEQFMVGNTPLTRVETAADMVEGAFYIDYSTHKVFAWLPKSADATKTQVIASTRSTLFAPSKSAPGTAENIRVEGLTFRHASNFVQSQQAAVRTDNGWVVVDSKIQYVNSTGLGVFGNDVTILRVVAENNGQTGIGSALSNNVLVKDSVTRFNNYRKVRVMYEGGGGKWARTNNVYLLNYTANGNFGPGIWFDTENTNIVVKNSEVFDNVGVANVNEGPGIFFEISPGPIRIEGNYAHNNTDAGVLIAESQNVTIRGNTMIDNFRGVSIRDMSDRIYSIKNLKIVDNQFRGWGEAGIGTLQGVWNADTADLLNISIEGNTYDYTGSAPRRMFRWGPSQFKTLAELQDALGFEQDGAMASVKAPSA